MFNITTVLLDTFIVFPFGLENLFKNSSAHVKCEHRELTVCKLMQKYQTHLSDLRGCILPFVSVNIAGLAVNHPLSEFRASA